MERIVNFVKEQAEADYDDAFDPGEASGQITEVCAQTRVILEEASARHRDPKASASMSSVAYRLVSTGDSPHGELEAAGVIGPEGTKFGKYWQQS